MKLKIAILAISAFALSTNANAQSSAKNYPVCKTNGGYKICTHAEKHNNMSTMNKMTPQPAASSETTSVTVKTDKPCVQPVTEVVYISSSAKENPRFRVSYDMPGDAYDGKDVMSNDGVAKNKERNKNYLDWSVNRPPNDGGLASK